MEEVDKPPAEQIETYRCFSLVTCAAVSTQLFCSCMRNVVTKWLMENWVGRRLRMVVVLVLISFGERSGLTMMPGRGWERSSMDP